MRSMNKFILMGSAFLLAAGATNANASCDSVLSSYSWLITEPGMELEAAELVSTNPECFGGSATTSQTQISSTSVQQAIAISTALAARTLGASPMDQQTAGRETKSMAGGGKSAFNTWISGSINSTDQNYTAANTFNTKNETDIRTGIFGADYALSPTMAAGLSVALDDGDGLGINAAAGSTPNIFTSNGYLIAPYFGIQITNELAADVSAGLGKGEMDISGNVSTDSDRLFAAANLSYSKWLGNAQLTGKLGYIHAEEKYDNMEVLGVEQLGTSAKNKLDQLRGGVQAGYWMDGVMPYAGLSYSEDVNRSTTLAAAPEDPIGEEAFQWTLGVNFISPTIGLSAGFAYSQEAGRSNQDNDVIMANLNYRF